MKHRINRHATPEEGNAIIETMALRAKAGEEVRAALARQISPKLIAEAIASLPAESQRQFIQPTVRRTFKITRRKQKP